MPSLSALFSQHDWLLNIKIAVLVVLAISIVVFVHEFGHYWVARRCGIRVISFSINFGKALFGWTDKHGTRWQVGWLPLGGYVKMFGDADPASSPDEAVKTMTEEEKKVSFFHQSVNKRMAVVIAGPAANYIFAIAVMALLFMFQGQPLSPPIIGQVIENSAAAHAGLQVGDEIKSMDGASVSRFDDIVRLVSLNVGTPMTVAVERQGVVRNVTVTPDMVTLTNRFGGVYKTGRLGIASDKDKFDYKKYPPGEAIEQAALETWHLTSSTLTGLGQMIAGTRSSNEIGGPIMIVRVMGRAAQDGMQTLIWVMAIISVNLGLINLFPVPLLDGGHLLFYSYEKLFRRPMGEKVQEIGFRIGLALVASLMLFATWNDLMRLDVVSKLRAYFS